MKNPDRPELSKELEDSFCSTDPKIARRFAEVTFFSDNRKDLGRSVVPALIMQCSEDAIAPDFVGDYMKQHLPRNRFVKMRATGHCPHMSHPDETSKIIEQFLSVEVLA
jgi:sigma-B regulation protein RsbQ